MKHQSQLHLCVFLIYPSLYSSFPPPTPLHPPRNHHPPPSSHLPLGKLRASLSWPKWEWLICSSYLFVINSPPIISSALLSLYSPLWKHGKKEKRHLNAAGDFFPLTNTVYYHLKTKMNVENGHFPSVISFFLSSSTSSPNSPVLPPTLTSLHCPQMDVFPLGSSK